ncbi:cytochrome c1 [Wenxinia marina]|uniref:Cytochrome c1 n=1 Tax=Wenxinia marina DSM 24838 TaxID=1123501 RepID=A0A0D0NSJ2_9RHOB|nr:cytochrome c1 [Wenxinia marina]KIQ71170.1 Cytochrome c1 [Wenxinia marina DSM 24838]GGL54289.1 cytochrome c [Wenxinia marina]
MIKTLTLSAALALGLGGAALAAESGGHVEDFDFSFEGPFGSYDQMQLQRGLQIYTEICAACHGLEYVSFRNLSEEGGPMLPEEQMRAYAQYYEIYDETLNDGEGDYRLATPADRFPQSSLSNAPDLSLMAKARAGFHGPYGLGINQFLYGMGGPEYVATLLVAYEEEPECAADAGMEGYYNSAFTAGGYPDSCKIFEEVETEVTDEDGNVTTTTELVEVGRQVPGSWIAMPQPLYGDDVEFADGHSTELHHEAEDVAAFLMWAAEPHLNARKAGGLQGVIFLVVLSVLLYLANKRLWAPHKGKH